LKTFWISSSTKQGRNIRRSLLALALPPPTRSATISLSLPIPGASQVRVFRRRAFMAGQSDPHLSIFSPSEVTNSFPSTLHRQGTMGSEVGCNPIFWTCPVRAAGGVRGGG